MLQMALAVFQQQPGGDAAGVSVIPGMSSETQLNLIVSLAIVVLLFFARRGIMAVVNRRIESQTLRYRWAKGTGYSAFLVGGLLLVQVWFTAIQSLGTFLGLLSAGLAIALKDLVADLAGWFFILWRRPFDLGDRIEVGGFAGDVVDRRIFQFTIMEIGNWIDADQSTGRLIHIPNATLFTQPLANYVSGFPYLWNELKVTVTFESDWRRAKTLLMEMVSKASVETSQRAADFLRKRPSRMLISYGTVTSTVYTSVLDHGICLSMRFLTDPRRRRAFDQTLWEGVLDILSNEPDIELAYPTQRIVGVGQGDQGSAGDPAQLQGGWLEGRGRP